MSGIEAAEETPHDHQTAKVSPARSNQGVSLDGSKPVRAAPAQEDHASVTPSSTYSGSGATGRADDGAQPTKESSSYEPALLPPKPGAAAGADWTGVGHREPQPWYRTGLGALALVLAMIAVLTWLVRRWVPSVRASDQGLISIAARCALTPKQSIVLLRLGCRFVVAGLSPDRIDRLCEITDPEEVADLMIRCGARDKHSTGAFEDVFRQESSEYDRDRSCTKDDVRRSHKAPAGMGTAVAGLLKRIRGYASGAS